MNKFLLIVTLIISIASNIFGQRTSVKGYFRKNGTYVSPHTRSSRSGSSSYSGSYSNSYTTDEPVQINESSLSIQNNESKDYKSSYQYKSNSKNLKSGDSPLTIVENTDTVKNALPLYISVLRYKGKIIDICPIPKSILSYDYDFSYGRVYHKISKQKMSSEHIVELISNYGFTLEGDDLKLSLPIRSYKMEREKINESGFLTHSFEVINLN